LTTQLVDPLTAKKKFVDSLTYYKQYLDNPPDSLTEEQVVESSMVHPTVTVKRVRSSPRIRKIKPLIQKRTIVVVEENVEESTGVHPTVTLKRIRTKPHVRKVKPKVLTRKKTLVFTVQEVVTEETESFNSEVVADEATSFESKDEAVEEATSEQAVPIDVDKLTEDDFYKILHFLESERDKMEGAKKTPVPSWTKYSRKRVY
jgi:hypothetical protein